MVVDVQCIMENIANVATCYHTKLITTNPRAKMASGETVHIEFDEHHALEDAKEIVKTAVDNFPNRRADDPDPQGQRADGGGFQLRSHQLSPGRHLPRLLHPAQRKHHQRPYPGHRRRGRLQQRRTCHDSSHLIIVKELLKNDVIVLTTGCNAMACGKAGLLTPEAAAVYCGPGLAEVCETVGIPPVLHMGSCVDNSRILMAATGSGQGRRPGQRHLATCPRPVPRRNG